MPTHGSLTKAGKVRSATNALRVESRGPKRKTSPRTENRRKYVKRFLSGETEPRRRRRR